MNYDKFAAAVRERDEYADRAEAEGVTGSVLEVLARRLAREETEDLAEQLPAQLAGAVRRRGYAPAGTFGVEEFCRRVAVLTGARPRTAERDASAVLSTLAEAVSGGQLNQLVSQPRPVAHRHSASRNWRNSPQPTPRAGQTSAQHGLA